MTDQSNAVARLGELLEDIDFCMLTTIDGAGQLHARPMSTQKMTFDGTLHFLTDRGSHKVEDIERNAQVLVSYADPKAQNYVAVHGRARVERDDELIEELWSPAHRAWWPDGRSDPSIMVLSVDVDRADYWESPGSKLTQIVGLAKVVLGAGSGEDLGDQGTIRP